MKRAWFGEQCMVAVVWAVGAFATACGGGAGASADAANGAAGGPGVAGSDAGSPDTPELGGASGQSGGAGQDGSSGGSGGSVAANPGGLAFAPVVIYRGGIQPFALAIGDLDGDGKPDVATANFSEANVGVMLNKGDGTFSATAFYPVSSSLAPANPVSIAIGDVDGDGKADLVAGTGDVSVLINMGGGIFGAPTIYKVAALAGVVALADLNGDHKLDVVVANGTKQLSVLVNAGGGTFAAPINYPMDSAASGLVIGQLDADDHPDVVVSGSDGKVRVFLNDGTGALGAPVAYPTGRSGGAMALGDLNGDHKLDLAVSSHRDGSLSILTGGGDGTFGPAFEYSGHGGPVALGDLDGDGISDLALADLDAQVQLNNGDGTFGPGSAVSFGGVNATETIAFGDVNGDGKLDLVTGLDNVAGVGVRLNISTGGGVAARTVTGDACALPMPNPAGAGLPNPASYDTSVAGVVSERVTGLVWERAPVRNSYTFDQAKSYCTANRLAGASDWRLPTFLELTALTDFMVKVSAQAPTAVDPIAFPSTPIGPFWSTTAATGSAPTFWVLDFQPQGGAARQGATAHAQVRCVRAGTSHCAPRNARYTKTADLVTDTLTGLSWQRSRSPAEMLWMDAQTYCARLAGGGFRPPSINELQTILDFAVPNGSAIDTAGFGASGESLWSSSLVAGDAASAWALVTTNGLTVSSPTTTPYTVRCVRP